MDAIDEEGETRTFRIVGRHFADAAKRRISPASPLAQALTGAAAGDVVTWRKPSGDGSWKSWRSAIRKIRAETVP